MALANNAKTLDGPFFVYVSILEQQPPHLGGNSNLRPICQTFKLEDTRVPFEMEDVNDDETYLRVHNAESANPFPVINDACLSTRKILRFLSKWKM